MNVAQHKPDNLTLKIIIGMALGLVVGMLLRVLPLPDAAFDLFVTDILKTGGSIFITVLKMLVVPVVLVSLICGAASINPRKIGRVGGKTLLLYLLTTALAITLALIVASIFQIGKGVNLPMAANFTVSAAPSLREIILNLFPANPFKALVEGNMLQVIIFALIFGVALTMSGEPGKRVIKFFEDLNHIVINLVILVMRLAPYGVFCLIAVLFAELGFKLIWDLLGYFLVVMLVLFIQVSVSYTLILRVIGRLNPIIFLKKMYQAMLFAFSVSSSNASIPIVLETAEKKLGVKNSIASFVIPLGATINMDGTSIMQGVATVFIAHVFNIDIGLMGYLTVIGMATLASIGTAGVPSVGLITLAMVLNQVGIPVEGIALIIGVDRLLDMTRTAVNITGDAMVACVVGKSENGLDETIYNNPQAHLEEDVA